MEVRAIAKYIRVQPRKVRLIADHVVGKPARRTVDVLRFHPSKSAKVLRKVILSAIANAEENNNLSADELRIREIRIDDGPRIKRIQARAMGRANRIIKRTSHITVVVEDYQPEDAVRPHGTKAKPRPTFDKPKGTKRRKAAVAPKEESAPKTEPAEEQGTSVEAGEEQKS